MTESASTPWRVVVADDDVPLRTLLRHIIGHDQRFTVIGEAGDGRQALEIVAEHLPDLLLLDLAMPEMHGLDVLRNLPQEGRPEVVVLTGLNDADLEPQALAAGAAAYLEKGIAFSGLTERLAQVLGGPQDATIELPTQETLSSRDRPS